MELINAVLYLIYGIHVFWMRGSRRTVRCLRPSVFHSVILLPWNIISSFGHCWSKLYRFCNFIRCWTPSIPYKVITGIRWTPIYSSPLSFFYQGNLICLWKLFSRLVTQIRKRCSKCTLHFRILHLMLYLTYPQYGLAQVGVTIFGIRKLDRGVRKIVIILLNRIFMSITYIRLEITFETGWNR